MPTIQGRNRRQYSFHSHAIAARVFCPANRHLPPTPAPSISDKDQARAVVAMQTKASIRIHLQSNPAGRLAAGQSITERRNHIMTSIMIEVNCDLEPATLLSMVEEACGQKHHDAITYSAIPLTKLLHGNRFQSAVTAVMISIIMGGKWGLKNSTNVLNSHDGDNQEAPPFPRNQPEVHHPQSSISKLEGEVEVLTTYHIKKQSHYLHPPTSPINHSHWVIQSPGYPPIWP